jgi:hypothetical protein
MRKSVRRSGQVWIETVIYTLIAFVMIGAILAVAKPRIDQLQDKILVEQSIETLKEIDSLVFNAVQGGPGNKRLIEVGITRGVLKVDGINDKLIFELEGKHEYSEPGQEISDGNVLIKTEKQGKLRYVNLTRDYSENHDITFQDNDEIKSLSKASTSYKLLVSNNGKGDDDRWLIDIKVT